MAAPTVSIVVTKDEITPLLRKLKRGTTEAVQETIERAVFRMSNATKFNLSTRWGARSGRVYGNHVASAPGEPPAPDTTNLLNSVVEDIRPLEGEVGVTARYGAFLELGTPSIAPRPYLQPAFDTALDGVLGDLNRELRRRTRK